MSQRRNNWSEIPIGVLFCIAFAIATYNLGVSWYVPNMLKSTEVRSLLEISLGIKAACLMGIVLISLMEMLPVSPFDLTDE